MQKQLKEQNGQKYIEFVKVIPQKEEKQYMTEEELDSAIIEQKTKIDEKQSQLDAEQEILEEYQNAKKLFNKFNK